MAILLQILGLAFLLMIIFVVVAALVIRSKVKGFAKNLAGAMQDIASSVPPARIELKRLAAPGWANAQEAEAYSREIAALGFEKVGNYEIDPIPGFELEAWVDPKRSIYSTIDEHPKAGIWFDFFTHFADGTRITFSNSKIGGVDHAPGHTVERSAGERPAQVLEKFLAARPDKPARPTNRDTFVEDFERVYAEERDWRNSRGGATEEEIRKVAMLSGRPLDESLLQQTRALQYAQAMEQLKETLREQFLADTNMSAAEWEGIRDRVIIIHDQLNEDAFHDAVSDILEEADIDDDVIPELDGTPESAPRRAFETLMGRLPQEYQCRRLGTVSRPVEADVYALPD